VSEQQRAPRLDKVHVPAAVDVLDPRAAPAGGEAGCAAHGAERPHGRVDAAGDQRPGSIEQVLGSVHVTGQA
jgi:hypothetical protein